MVFGYYLKVGAGFKIDNMINRAMIWSNYLPTAMEASTLGMQ